MKHDPCKATARFHLPGLFEFQEFYKAFLPLLHQHPEYFYPWCKIDTLYGAPSDCLWSGGRFGSGAASDVTAILELLEEYGISACLTFSNSLLRREHLSDRICNELCRILSQRSKGIANGVIVHAEVLMAYLQQQYPELYLVSSTTKVLTEFSQLAAETRRPEFRYVVPDFRLNKSFSQLNMLSEAEKDKLEFLCNECCWVGCQERRACYENVSRRVLGETCPEHRCTAPNGSEGYRFSRAMQNPMFLSLADIRQVYLPQGYSSFKIEGRGLGSALLLEFLLYYLVKPEKHLQVRELLYLDSMLDLF